VEAQLEVGKECGGGSGCRRAAEEDASSHAGEMHRHPPWVREVWVASRGGGKHRGGEESGRKKENKLYDMWGPMDIELSLKRSSDYSTDL
jgi:hypothetical protein